MQIIPPYDIRTRKDFPKLINTLGLKRGAEIGVCLADFSEFLLENSDIEVLYSIDPWCEDEDITHSAFKRCDTHSNKQETRYQAACNLLGRFGDQSVIIRKLSQEAYSLFEDESLDFIYLDGSHRFTGFALDLIYWYPKLREGGLFSGHDYWHKYRNEVCPALGAFAIEQRQFFYLTTHERIKPIYPPTWWLIKKTRTKGEFVRLQKLHRSYYEVLVPLLKKRRAKVSLPYEYLH